MSGPRQSGYLNAAGFRAESLGSASAGKRRKRRASADGPMSAAAAAARKSMEIVRTRLKLLRSLPTPEEVRKLAEKYAPEG